MNAPEQERIGHYVVEAPLGRGAMGAVYLARDQRIGRRVALKQLQIKADFEDSGAADEFYQRLQREAEVCGSLQHPNIVTLYDVGYENDRVSYLALEYVAGPTLLDLLKRTRPRPLPMDIALRITADILRGLTHAHARGIVHRDIKPANILVDHDGVAKIADFGIARPQQSSMTLAGSLMGTPNYMPPEQVKGVPATPRSDLFSLGVLLFEMVTGAKPFAAGELAAVLENIVRMPTPSAMALNPAVPPDLDALIQRLTAKEPEDRYGSAAEALAELDRIRGTVAPAPTSIAAADETIAVTGPPAGRGLRRPIADRWFFAITFAALLLAAAPCVAIWSAIDDQGSAPLVVQRAELARKREALRAADDLYRAGKYAESLKAYEAHLARYPQSLVARDGIERARRALAAHAVERAPEKKPEPKPTVIQKMRRGVRRIFGGK
jgi:tRNA A-37 threonylcarbamoyl transferase component Bud32